MTTENSKNQKQDEVTGFAVPILGSSGFHFSANLNSDGWIRMDITTGPWNFSPEQVDEIILKLSKMREVLVKQDE